MALSYSAYQTGQSVSCPHCHWQGSSKQLSSGDYHPHSNILDLDCPACGQHLTFVQFPVDHSKLNDKEEDKPYW
jgi:hypothetical protein